jgi:cell fate (sporulation/competence/biofilm development) regulator YlbF (YheA/YmcA/DUF963 family)
LISFFHQKRYEKKAQKIIEEFEMTRLTPQEEQDKEPKIDYKELMSLETFYNMNV